MLRILFRQEGAWLLGLKVAETHGLCWAVASLFLQFRGPDPFLSLSLATHSLKFRLLCCSGYLYAFPGALLF